MEVTRRHTYWGDDYRLGQVCKGEMEGTSVALRRPKLYPTARRRHHVDTIRMKEFNNVSALFICITNNLTGWQILLKNIKDRYRAWGQLRHKNVLPLLGVTKNHALVTPRIVYTTLRTCIYRGGVVLDLYKIVRLNFLIYIVPQHVFLASRIL